MARDYVELFKQALPKGAFWVRDLGTIAHDLYTGLSAEAARIGARAEDLYAEMDPRTATEMIGDWETVLGLPDPEDDNPPTSLEDRRAVAHARFIARGAEYGGSSRTLLTQLLVALGYDADDVMFRVPAAQPFICGRSRCMDPVNAVRCRFFTEIIVRSQSDVIDAAAKRLMRRYVLASYQITDPDLYRAPTFAFPLALWSDATIEGGVDTVLTNPRTGGETTVPEDSLGTIWIDGPNTEVALYPSE